MGEPEDEQGRRQLPLVGGPGTSEDSGWNQGEEFELRRGVQPGGYGERAGRGDDRR